MAAIQAGDCVLWTGAGIGALVERPSWAALLAELAAGAEPDTQAELEGLLARGDRLTVLDWLRRHQSDALEASLAAKIDEDKPLPPSLCALGQLRWRGCLATVYPDLLARAREAGGHERPRVSRDASKGMPRDHVLHTSVSEDLRRDHDLRELVEEAVRTSTLVLLGFELGDPDLRQILAILRRIPASGGSHYLFLPEIGGIEAEQLRERSGLQVCSLPEGGVDSLLDRIATAVGDEQAESRAPERLAALELSRVLRPVPVRVDVGVDAAFAVDPHEVDLLVDALPGGIESLPARDLLRLGSVWLAHARVSGKTQSRWHKRARKAFVQVIALDDDARDMRVARFNLALLALVEGDEEAARTGLEAAAEQDRNLALVSPRFALATVRGRVGSRIWLECHDRAADNELVAIEVGTLGRPVSPDERRRFIEQVGVLAEIDHPALVRVREGVAEGRVFGVIMQPEQGVPLARLLEQTAEPLALDKAFELIGPLMEVVGLAHAKGLVHRNLHPRHVLITQDGAKLRGFGFLPLVSWSRPAIVRENHGYAAPELFAGAAPSPASDTYALAALLYRCITGKLPLGSVPAPSRLVTGIDMRVDALLAKAMHPDPEQRPDPKGLRTEVATILTTPHKFDQVAAATPVEQPAPAAPAKPTGPVKLVEPEDPDDLDAWKWILEQKSSHLPAREAISRIEREARAAQRWDRVAEVLDIRARSSQAESEKIVLLRELAEISEQRLDAPGTALDALLLLIDTISVNAQVPLVEDLLRLAEVTGRWAAVAEKLHAVGRRVPSAADQLRILSRAALIYLEQAGDLGRAIAVYEDALDLEPENLDLQRAALVAYRKADRPAELATGLLTIAELETGPVRHEALIEAAQILGDLGEFDGALEAAEHVRAEDPENHRALAASEQWARELERWDLLAKVLPAQAAGNLDDAEATALRKEAAQIMLERLQDEAGAISMYRQIIERDRSDKTTAEALLELLRPKASGDSGEAASAREGLIDALSVLTDITEDTGRRAELLAEAAGLLDREPDGGERAADCRERIVETLPVDHALVLDAVAGLTRFYLSQDAHEPLAELLERRAKLTVLGRELRVSAYKQLQELAAGPLEDPARERAALEGLVELEPAEGRWRDLLIERLRDAGEQELAEQLLRQRIADADSPADRASMLVTVARMRERAGELEEAEARVREALELDESASRAWALLREILEQRDRPLEALEAQIRAAQTSDDPRVKVRELFAAATTWAQTLNKPERALPLIREIVQLDPHHPGATGMLVERLVERGELKEAWPHAERWVAQTRAGSPEDRELNARVHALAGRCALAVGNNAEARELLRDAKQFDPRNREVGRALADLELESQSWDAALRAYQGLAIQAGEGEEPRVQAELYLRMGQARQGMGEASKALQMIERALDIDPAYVDAARFLVSLADSPAREVEAKQRLLTVLEAELASYDEDDDRREAKDQEILDLRLELATTLADQLNRPDEAVVLLRAVLARRPNDISLLHRSLDLFSNAEQWAEAVGVLDRLATLQDQGPIRAKYRYAAASLMRAHNLDTTGVVVRARLLGVLEADPLHDKAFKAVRDNLESSGEWRELSKVLRSRLKITPEDQPEVRIDLLDSIASIYDRHLDDKRTAMIAYEQAITLTKTLGASDDDERQTERRNKVISLSVQLGDDALDKGIEQVQALIRDNPLDYDSYHRLVELYLAAKQRDASVAVSRTLRFLKQADEAELELAAELGDNYQPPRGTISRKQWRDVILPSHPSSRLSDLYGLLWPVMAAREGLTHASANVDRSQRETVTMQAAGVTRWVAYMAQVIDIPPPDLYLRKGEPGGFRVTALGDPKGVYPTLLGGDEALGRQPDAALAFRAGRAVASTHPHLLGASVMPSVSSLRNAIYGAVGLTHPQVAIPKELRDPARGWAEAIKKMLPPSRLDDLRKAVAKVIERGGADTKSWLRGCEHASARAGFLVSDSLDVSARVILQGSPNASVDGRELIKGLIAFSVSTPYLELRRTLKLG
ncbi:Serine/threonine protein kinase [Enhygromyxa salina]|uniref:Serine/threonine protein kinase n=1 Tax=Enhygromyxa salina TaxID=215803 RepID=A0A0C2D0P9_9BACT|nr:Serine/threonine protein kinase [Enhygromyxa salina]